jgi:hypothetical protein
MRHRFAATAVAAIAPRGTTVRQIPLLLAVTEEEMPLLSADAEKVRV